VIGVTLGAGVTYFVQTRTQRSVWKREYGIKIAEEVYGKLYGNINPIITMLEKKSYERADFNAWEEIKLTHRYFMVDKKFRETRFFFKKNSNIL
jgi:hypothetical protein